MVAASLAFALALGVGALMLVRWALPLELASSSAQITVQGRLLGLADVFEALTAPDRPYRDPRRSRSCAGW